MPWKAAEREQENADQRPFVGGLSEDWGINVSTLTPSRIDMKRLTHRPPAFQREPELCKLRTGYSDGQEGRGLL